MSTQKALLHVSEGVSQLKTDVPLPKLPSGNWMLVKTKAVALNPTDWKNIHYYTAYVTFMYEMHVRQTMTSYPYL